MLWCLLGLFRLLHHFRRLIFGSGLKFIDGFETESTMLDKVEVPSLFALAFLGGLVISA